MERKFSLSEDRIFSIFIFTRLSKSSDLSSCQLSDDTWLLINPLEELKIDLEPWVGQERFQDLSRSNFALVQTQKYDPDKHPNHAALIEVQRYLHILVSGLFLQGFPDFGIGFFITGIISEGTIRNALATDDIRDHKNPFLSTWLVDKFQIERAIAIRPSIHSVYQSDDTFRLRRGFGAWRTATEEFYADERLHQCVRALEAIFPPYSSSNANSFAKYCQLFTGEDPHRYKFFHELYRIRNHTEHMIPILNTFFQDRPISDRGPLLWKRAAAAELLCAKIYLQIVSEDQKFKLFGSDTMRNEMWSRVKNKSENIWRNRIDLEELLSGHFDAESVKVILGT